MGKRKVKNDREVRNGQPERSGAEGQRDGKRQRAQAPAQPPAAASGDARRAKKRTLPAAAPSSSSDDEPDAPSDDTGASSSAGSDDDGSGGGSSSQGASAVDDGEELEVEFDFGDPEEGDFHIVKALFQRYLHDPNFDSSTVADVIVDQAEVSVALRTTESCVGVAAFLPWAAFGSTQPFQQLAAAWRKRATAGGCAAQLDAVFAGGRAALLVSERVHNAPAQVAAGVFACLCKELRDCAACKDADVRKHAAFDNVLVCAKAYEDREGGVGGTGAVPVTRGDKTAASTSKGTSKPAGHGAQSNLVFMKAEDEALFERCEWSCSWPIPQDGSFKGQVALHRVLICVSRGKLDTALRHTASLFGHDLSQHGL